MKGFLSHSIGGAFRRRVERYRGFAREIGMLLVSREMEGWQRREVGLNLYGNDL
jgi:hypothetical protein